MSMTQCPLISINRHSFFSYATTDGASVQKLNASPQTLTPTPYQT